MRDKNIIRRNIIKLLKSNIDTKKAYREIRAYEKNNSLRPSVVVIILKELSKSDYSYVPEQLKRMKYYIRDIVHVLNEEIIIKQTIQIQLEKPIEESRFNLFKSNNRIYDLRDFCKYTKSYLIKYLGSANVRNIIKDLKYQGLELKKDKIYDMNIDKYTISRFISQQEENLLLMNIARANRKKIKYNKSI